MSIIQAVIAGTVQGVTEFLPVSSSGHLVLLDRFFNIAEPDIFFDICLHLGTLLAVIAYFRKEILSMLRGENVVWILYLAVGTVPAVIAAIFFEDRIEAFFGDPQKVAYMLIVTALILFAGQLSLRKGIFAARKSFTWGNTIFVGIAQALALLPGISRSGATISAGLVSGMKREMAFTYSFLLSIPAVAGAALYKGVKNIEGAEKLMNQPAVYYVGTGAAFAVGLMCLPLLSKMIKGDKLYLFGVYCLIVGSVGFFLCR